jgi:hypothetical protein
VLIRQPWGPPRRPDPSRGGNQGCSADATVVTGRIHSGRHAGDVWRRRIGSGRLLSSAVLELRPRPSPRRGRSFWAGALGRGQLRRLRRAVDMLGLWTGLRLRGKKLGRHRIQTVAVSSLLAPNP